MMLREIINKPTNNIKNLLGNLVVSLAAKGAIVTPPITNPAIISG